MFLLKWFCKGYEVVKGGDERPERELQYLYVLKKLAEAFVNPILKSHIAPARKI